MPPHMNYDWPLPTDDEVADLIRSVPCHYASLFFVGSNWSDGTNSWATSSGGTPGHLPPTSSDQATIDTHSGDCTVDTPAVCLTISLGVAYTHTVTLAASLTVSGNLNLNGGNLNSAGLAIGCTAFASPGTTSRSLTLGASTFTLSGTGTVWSTTTTGLTLSAASSTILISDTSATTKTFAGGSRIFGNLTLSGSAGVVTFTGTNTFATFTSGASNLAFTNTQTATTFNLAGCLSLTGNLAQASGTVTAPSGCTVTNSTASGGAKFILGQGSIDGGGNSGWQRGSTTDGKSF